MIDGISGILGRIQEIGSRIDEIKSLGRNPAVNPVIEKKDENASKADEKQSFNDILKEVMGENKAAGTGGMPLESESGRYINSLVGSTGDNTKLLELLYKNINSPAGNADIPGIISEASKKFSVDEPLIKAVINQESGFNKNAVSPKGAMGLMQLMPETAGLLGVGEPFDPRENIMGGTKYLKMLMEKYGNNLNNVLAAYNAGPQAVDRAGGIPDIPETRNYVKMVLKYYNDYKLFS